MQHRADDKRIKQATGARRCGSGFTLIELLVVIAIIMVLVAASFPLFRKIRESARSTTCISNVRQLGAGIILHANDNGQKLLSLQPEVDPATGKRPPIWPVTLAWAGIMWSGEGELPCGTGVWTCPSCDFMSNAYGGYGVVEDTVFVYGENYPVNVREPGSLRLNRIARPESTWLVGDAAQSPDKLNKGWYAIWSLPKRWDSHCPAPRHGGKVNVCMVDGHVESLTTKEIEERELTFNVVR